MFDIIWPETSTIRICLFFVSKTNTEIEENVSIPPAAKCVGILIGLKHQITSLDLINAQIRIIERYSFSNCYKLRSIRFPPCLEDVCGHSFENRKNLERIRFGYKSMLKIIGLKAFYLCRNLKKFKFPSNLEIICKKAFFSYEKLGVSKKSVIDLRNTKVKDIGLEAFFRCHNGVIYFLATITVNSIIVNNFHVIKVSRQNQNIQEDDDGNYYSYKTFLHGNKAKKYVTIRCVIERIARMCFYNSNLVSVSIPESVIEL